MQEKLKDFANWLWDMGLLKVENQIPPFNDAEKLAEQYAKAMKSKTPTCDSCTHPLTLVFNCNNPDCAHSWGG